MASPFSAVPTPFLVEMSSFSCFGNCIWDALGIPAMLHQDARIKTTCGDCGLALQVNVVNDQVQSDPSIIHFAIPAHHWWDDHWCQQWKLERGALLSLEQGWRLAQAWYSPDRRQPTWQRKTVDETEALLQELGLTSPFWNLR